MFLTALLCLQSARLLPPVPLAAELQAGLVGYRLTSPQFDKRLKVLLAKHSVYIGWDKCYGPSPIRVGGFQYPFADPTGPAYEPPMGTFVFWQDKRGVRVQLLELSDLNTSKDPVGYVDGEDYRDGNRLVRCGWNPVLMNWVWPEARIYRLSHGRWRLVDRRAVEDKARSHVRFTRVNGKVDGSTIEFDLYYRPDRLRLGYKGPFIHDHRTWKAMTTRIIESSRVLEPSPLKELDRLAGLVQKGRRADFNRFVPKNVAGRLWSLLRSDAYVRLPGECRDDFPESGVLEKPRGRRTERPSCAFREAKRQMASDPPGPPPMSILVLAALLTTLKQEGIAAQLQSRMRGLRLESPLVRKRVSRFFKGQVVWEDTYGPSAFRIADYPIDIADAVVPDHFGSLIIWEGTRGLQVQDLQRVNWARGIKDAPGECYRNGNQLVRCGFWSETDGESVARVYVYDKNAWRLVSDDPGGAGDKPAAHFARRQGSVDPSTIVVLSSDLPTYIEQPLGGPLIQRKEIFKVTQHGLRAVYEGIVPTALSELDVLAGLARQHKKPAFDRRIPANHKATMWKLLQKPISVTCPHSVEYADCDTLIVWSMDAEIQEPWTLTMHFARAKGGWRLKYVQRTRQE